MFVQLGTSVGLLAPTLEGDARVLIVIAKFRLEQTRTPFAFNNFRKTRMTFAAGMVSSTSNWCKGLSNSPARLREIGERD